MKTKAVRSFSFVLALVFALSAFVVLPVFAASESKFVFGSLVGEDGSVYTASNQSFSLPLSKGSVFKARDLNILQESSNALYLSLVNNSNATAVRVSYTYGESATKHTEAAEYPLEKGIADQQDVTLPLPHIAQSVTALEISFVTEGSGSGSVTLLACFNVSAYIPQTYTDDNGAPWATVTRCHYNASEGVVEIVGELSYAATAHFVGQSLALFALEAGEDLYLSRKTPVARTGMSLDFSFSVPVESSDDLFARYVVAAVNSQGASTPLCTPSYPSVTSEAIIEETAFKGFHTDSFSTVLDCTPGVELVDVYLDRLQTAQSSGLLYVGEHSYYYFDQEYVNEIDRLVRNLTGIGTHVYLRFLIGADCNDASFADFSESDVGVLNKLPVIRGSEAQHDLYAITDFLTGRYADQTIGRISGVVIGRSADRADTHNYSSAADLSEYAALYAGSLNLIAATTRQNLPNAKIIVPLSDRIWSQSFSAEQASGNYYMQRFLPSLLAALRSQILEPQQFSVMLESEQTPQLIAESIGTEYGTDRLDDFFDLLVQYNKTDAYLETSIFYAWTPQASLRGQDLKAAYLLQYITLFRNSMVDAFFADFSLLESQGLESGMSELSYLARYIDTDRFSDVCGTAIAALGVSDLKEIFPDFKQSELQTRKTQTLSLTANAYASNVSVTGSYRFWNFSSSTDTLGWYHGTGCNDLSVLTDQNNERALVAQLNGSAPYGDLAYHFNSAVDLSFAPLLCFEAAVQGSEGARYEVQLRFVGTSQTVIASTILTAGEHQRLYLDLSQNIAALYSLRAIRLVARPLDGDREDFKLCLYNFDLESDRLTDDELNDRVTAILKSNSSGEAEPVSKRDYTVPLIATAVVVLFSAGLIVFLVVKRRHHRAAQHRNESK